MTIHPRINNGTYELTKREQRGTDQFRVRLHVPEDPGQRAYQFPFVFKIAIVSAILAGVFPQPLRGVEFWGVGR